MHGWWHVVAKIHRISGSSTSRNCNHNPKFIEMEDQSEQTKELDASMKEIVDKLTAENEKLKDMVITREQKIDKIKQKSEKWLKKATEAESKILEMKTTIQRLQEKINAMEEQNLRRQFMMSSPASERRSSFAPKGPESDHIDSQGSPSMQRFNGSLRQFVIDQKRENVDFLIKASTEDLGFSNRKPVVTYVIYKSLLHWKTFEEQNTNVFDRLIVVFGNTIKHKEEDNKHMCYWLSVTSTLLFLLQMSLSSGSGKPPTGFLGRMAQRYHAPPSYSGLKFVRHVDANYRAVLFKMQLTAYAEKIYGTVRDNLKKELSQHISCCIQSARSRDKTPPSMYWQQIIEALNGMLRTLKEYYVSTVLVQKIYTQVFGYINIEIFNSLLLHRDCCSFSNGEYLKAGLAELERWCSHVTQEYAGSSWDELKHTRQAVGFLVIRHKSNISYDDLIKDLCSILSVQQIFKICSNYIDDIYSNQGVGPAVISALKDEANDSRSSYMDSVLRKNSYGNPSLQENADSNSFLLEDDPSIQFSVDDLINSLNEKDFAEMKLTNSSIVQNPVFHFLLE